MVTLAEKLKNLIDSNLLKPSELSRMSLVPGARISEILSGKTTNPHRKTVVNLAKALNVDPDWLIDDSAPLLHSTAHGQATLSPMVAQALGGEMEIGPEETVLLMHLRELPTEQRRWFIDAAAEAWVVAKRRRK